MHKNFREGEGGMYTRTPSSSPIYIQEYSLVLPGGYSLFTSLEWILGGMAKVRV